MTPVSETPVIKTRGLTKRYRQLTALGDCAITVPRECAEVGLEEMVLAYMSQDAAPATPHLTTVGDET